MNAPRPTREYLADAPVPVQRPKRTSLKRHWLTGALVCGVLVLMGRTGMDIYRTEQHRQEVSEQRRQVQAQIDEAKRVNGSLKADLQRVSSDSYREVMAKQLGFVHPNETVYQKGK